MGLLSLRLFENEQGSRFSTNLVNSSKALIANRELDPFIAACERVGEQRVLRKRRIVLVTLVAMLAIFMLSFAMWNRTPAKDRLVLADEAFQESKAKYLAKDIDFATFRDQVTLLRNQSPELEEQWFSEYIQVRKCFISDKARQSFNLQKPPMVFLTDAAEGVVLGQSFFFWGDCLGQDAYLYNVTHQQLQLFEGQAFKPYVWRSDFPGTRRSFDFLPLRNFAILNGANYFTLMNSLSEQVDGNFYAEQFDARIYGVVAADSLEALYKRLLQVMAPVLNVEKPDSGYIADVSSIPERLLVYDLFPGVTDEFPYRIRQLVYRSIEMVSEADIVDLPPAAGEQPLVYYTLAKPESMESVINQNLNIYGYQMLMSFENRRQTYRFKRLD